MTTIHLHEIMDTVPGQEEPYMASVLSLEDDMVSRNIGARRGDISSATSTSRFRTTDVSGPWPKSVNLAEPGSFERAMHSLRSQFSGTGMSADMEDWWQRNTSLRTHGFDRWLLPASFSPARKDLLSKGLKGRVFLHEFIKVPWGETDGYLARLESDFLPTAARYEWLLFGAYTVAMSPREVLTVFFMREWRHMADLFAARDADPALRSWFRYREETIDESREMVLMPGHNNALFQWG